MPLLVIFTWPPLAFRQPWTCVLHIFLDSDASLTMLSPKSFLTFLCREDPTRIS
jgi:hypothetical protein